MARGYHRGNDNIYFQKNLVSLDKVTNSSGVVKQSSSFDAWGRRRNPTNWTYTSIPATIFSRGYTGHEHLDIFNLINMNGRMYDPILGRFLSPDKYVQAPDFTQSYNRYSYCFNNPLAYTDPSGYLQTELPVGAGGISFDNSWIHKEKQDGGAGKGAVGGPGDGDNGLGHNGVYFDWTTGTYRSVSSEQIVKGTSLSGLYIYTTHYIDYYDPITGCFIATRFMCTTVENFKLNTQNGENVASTAGIAVDGLSINYPFGPYTSWVGIIAQVAKLASKEKKPGIPVKFVSKWGTTIGWTGEVLSILISSVNVGLDPTWGNWGRLTVSGATFALNFVPYVGTGISFGISAIDAEGAFNDYYDALDNCQSILKNTGINILPIVINPVGF